MAGTDLNPTFERGGIARMTPDQWNEMRYFKSSEFDSPDIPGSGIGMQYSFMKQLDEIRHLCGFPFHIDSGIRSPQHNTDVGGVDSSSHVGGWAADILIAGRTGPITNNQRARIIDAATRQGINRIGIGHTFVHLDSDPTKPAVTFWLYDC